MMDYIWAGLILVALVTGAATGRMGEVSSAALDGAGAAVATAVMLLGVMSLWNGLMKIASKSGLINVFAFLMRPITKVVFPRLARDSEAMKAIVMNMTANFLGMANAATPLGLKAMRELEKISDRVKGVASDEMAMFVVVNTASIQLIPATVIAIRQAADVAAGGGGSPFEVIVPIWMVSFTTLTVGVIVAKVLMAAARRRGR